MSIATKQGWTQATGYVPTAWTLTAFAAGVQAALLFEAFTGEGYPPPGRGFATTASLFVLILSAALHLPFERLTDPLARAWNRLVSMTSRREVRLAAQEPPRTAVRSSTQQTNGAKNRSTLSARIHSPLSAGPVVAPDEPIPITIEAEPEHLAQDLTIHLDVHGPNGSHERTEPMQGTQHTLEERFDDPGAFQITITLEHPKTDAASKTLDGRVATYREEVARLFETLKEDLANQGLDVGPQSTPREAIQALHPLDTASPDELANLAVELEIALYGDDEIDRATYELIHQGIQTATGERKEVPG